MVATGTIRPQPVVRSQLPVRLKAIEVQLPQRRPQVIKAHPSTIPGDSDIYGASPSVVSLVLNARRLFDCNYGARFDENNVVRLGAVVGLLFHSAQVAEWDDSVLESFFRQLTLACVEKLYAIPTGYEYARDSDAAMEILDFEPPLLGSISPTIDDFSKVRSGQIGLYSGSHFLFSPCLNYSLLDVNGQYTMILGPRRFVDSVFGSTVSATWSEINPNSGIESSILSKLLDAKTAYGYGT